MSRLDDIDPKNSSVNIPVSAPSLVGNERNYLLDAFDSSWISSTGAYIEKFEKDFAMFSDCQYGVAVSNGTVALSLALIALGVGEGDEVIVPDLTFAATINAVLHTNATPVIVDVTEKSWCIDPLEIEKAITNRTKAIIPVHIYGQPCDMDEIMRIATENNIYVIEDCAEAHGATYKGKKVGSFGHIGCFSFFANKIITTGEGGMCVTNNEILNGKLRVFRDHGMSKDRRYWHEEIGFNYRMTNLQAAIGVAQLERKEEIFNARKQIEECYIKSLSDHSEITLQKNIAEFGKVSWLFSILVDKDIRDELIDLLKGKGCDIRPFFFPLSTMPIYKTYTFSNQNSIKISSRGLNLPTFVGLKQEEIMYISNIIVKFFERKYLL